MPRIKMPRTDGIRQEYLNTESYLEELNKKISFFTKREAELSNQLTNLQTTLASSAPVASSSASASAPSELEVQIKKARIDLLEIQKQISMLSALSDARDAKISTENVAKLTKQETDLLALEVSPNLGSAEDLQRIITDKTNMFETIIEKLLSQNQTVNHLRDTAPGSSELNEAVIKLDSTAQEVKKQASEYTNELNNRDLLVLSTEIAIKGSLKHLLSINDSTRLSDDIKNASAYTILQKYLVPSVQGLENLKQTFDLQAQDYEMIKAKINELSSKQESEITMSAIIEALGGKDNLVVFLKQPPTILDILEKERLAQLDELNKSTQGASVPVAVLVDQDDKSIHDDEPEEPKNTEKDTELKSLLTSIDEMPSKATLWDRMKSYTSIIKGSVALTTLAVIVGIGCALTFGAGIAYAGPFFIAGVGASYLAFKAAQWGRDYYKRHYHPDGLLCNTKDIKDLKEHAKSELVNSMGRYQKKHGKDLDDMVTKYIDPSKIENPAQRKHYKNLIALIANTRMITQLVQLGKLKAETVNVFSKDNLLAISSTLNSAAEGFNKGDTKNKSTYLKALAIEADNLAKAFVVNEPSIGVINNNLQEPSVNPQEELEGPEKEPTERGMDEDNVSVISDDRSTSSRRPIITAPTQPPVPTPTASQQTPQTSMFKRFGQIIGLCK